MRHWVASIFCLWIFGCDSWLPNEPALTARTDSPPVLADCASCHLYPVGGVNHQFHLMHADSVKSGNGGITCLDCHSHSLKERDVIVRDSLYRDAAGRMFSAYDSGAAPWFRDSVAGGRYALARVDTLVHHRPIPAPSVPGRVTFLQEWLTAGDHLNGVVDIRFDDNNSDLVRFAGQAAAYDPLQETCSAVACHTHDTPYRWPAPSKGLPGLNVDNTLK